MILAGLVASGETTIDEARFVRRGYENLTGDLVKLGASIDIAETVAPWIPT